MRTASSTAMIGALFCIAGGCALERSTVRGAPFAELDAAMEMDAQTTRDAHAPLDAPAPMRDAVAPLDAPPMPDASRCDPPPDDDVLHATPAGPIVIDGALDDWASATFVSLPTWVGPGAPSASDSSATIAAAWAPDALYLAIVVRDDRHHNDETATNLLWRGDSVQVAFDVAANATSAGYDTTDDIEYGWAEGPSGLLRHRWVAPAGAPAAAELARVVRGSDRTRYEIRLASIELGLASLSSGLRTRMGMIVNETDGGDREGFLEWGSGIGLSKDPRLFRDLVLGARLCDR